MTQTVNVELRARFDNEVRNFVKFLTNSNPSSPMRLEKPTGSIKDILEKYVDLGHKSLVKEGVRSMRAKSISKYTFDKLLESIMDEIQNQH